MCQRGPFRFGEKAAPAAFSFSLFLSLSLCTNIARGAIAAMLSAVGAFEDLEDLLVLLFICI
jgi:hypothetical protein